MKQYTKLSVLLVALAAATFSNLLAVPTIGNKDTFDGPLTWADNSTSLSVNQGVGYLELTVVNGSQPGGGAAFTTSSDFTGSYAGLPPGTEIQFDFTTFGANGPSGLSLYFQTTGGQEWYYSFEGTLPVGPGTMSYSAIINQYSTGWFNEVLPLNQQAAAFGSAIGDISQIGIYVTGVTLNGTDIYGLDNFSIVVPEPETVWMILAVALSLGMTFRGRLSDLAGQMKSRFVKA
jgi:hypothetical protein